ncbi:protein argonaute 16-like [Ananas comosus]|uniref:Protein argonaute 16-like n=1 Tax=Ananas comosus TaxID=4615 RepID=A0A6P5G9C3_ANACO|nr:protein argonaute 16-like [Ananas comosus]
MASQTDESGREALVQPSPAVPQRSQKPEVTKRIPMARPGFGTDGRQIQLLTNHFSVRFSGNDAVFYQYSVSIKSEDNRVVEGKGLGRKVIDKLHQYYSSELAGKEFVYDGEKTLFTLGPLPQNNFEFKVILEESSARGAGGSPGNGSPTDGDRKRFRRSQLSREFKVGISYAAKIPLKSITLALKGSESEQTQEALRVLDIILRQQQAKRGCLLVRQSFFNGEHTNFVDVGGGVTGCRGFHSSFHPTLGGLSLNMDVSTTMILTPGPVVDFLLANQNVKDPRQIDWIKAKRMLKNMRIKTRHRNMEFKIIGISELPCHQQTFPLKVKNGGGEGQTVEVTVFDYFKSRKIDLSWSANMPCLDVGKPKRPNYVPLELCYLVSLQRYTKALTSQQRASLVEKSRQKPQERIRVITDAVRNNRYDDDPLLSSCGIKIEKQLLRLDGRVLLPPTLIVGNKEDCMPRNGRWNFNNKRLWAPTKIERWAIVNFSARCDTSHLSRELINCGRNKGIHIERPFTLIDEDRQWLRSGPVVRVEKMFEKIKAQLPGPPQFLLCVLPERKNSDIYGPWKKKNLHEVGIVTQCISPTRINDQYLTNVLLKINSKLGGMNSLLAIEHTRGLPIVDQTPTMILGMDVSHGSPGRSDVPSIAAVVGSRQWPLISRYRASVRSQSPKVEMIDSLFKPQANGKDDGIIRELLVDFYKTSGARKPSQIIIFRDGVSESQFNQVLNIELNQIIQAFEHLGENSLPKFTVIVAQKNHHTKLFQADAPENVPPGTVVDSKIVHPRNFDFYMCAQAGMIGTSRPTHYHVLLDEIGFSVDNLQKFVHSLSYVYQRSTTAISVVAPICYAHLAAQQMSQFVKFEDITETSSGQGDASSLSGQPAVPDLPKLHENVCSSMFFC